MLIKLRKYFRRFLPQTLFARSLLIIVTPVLLLQIIVAVIFFDRHWVTMTSRLAFAVAGEVALVAQGLEAGYLNMDDTAPTLAGALGLLASFEKDARLTEKSRDTALPTAIENTLAQALRDKLVREFVILPDERNKRLAVQVQLRDGVLKIILPQNRLYSSTTYIFFLWMAGSSLVLIAVAILFMRNQVRPIRKLAEAAERFGKGLDVPVLRPRGASEIRQATEAFLEMYDRIRRQIEQRTAMLAGVSHDLRTPLTRMKLALAMLGKNAEADAIKDDIDDMERMIEGYLSFARGLGGESPLRVDMAEILERVVSGARREGSDVVLGLQGDLAVMVRPNAIERCVANLVTNARKYGKHVWVNAFRRDDSIEIVVDDDGPGIPPEKYEDVFRPFFRIDTSRNSATGGTGLGLSIARDIVHAHGGKIWLEKSNRGGLRAVVHLPV